MLFRSHAALEAHLATCASCRATRDELERVVARARGIGYREPATDLWGGIETSIAGNAPRSGRRLVTLSWARLATAAAIVAIRHKRHVDDAALVESLSSAEASPELGLDFQAAIARLPPGMRQIFVLHDIEGYKHDEIAGMLGIAQGTSKSQLHRVRMILRRYLGA